MLRTEPAVRRLENAAEALVSDDEVIVAFGRRAVVAVEDLDVRPADADLEDLDEHLVRPAHRCRHVVETAAARLSGGHDDCAHRGIVGFATWGRSGSGSRPQTPPHGGGGGRRGQRIAERRFR